MNTFYAAKAHASHSNAYTVICSICLTFYHFLNSPRLEMATAAAQTVSKTAAKFKKIIPLYNRVLVKKVDPIVKTKGGIVIPEDSKQKLLRGTVIAVGPGSRSESGHLNPVSVRPGDEVILQDYGGTKIEADGMDGIFMYRENDILAKIHD